MIEQKFYVEPATWAIDRKAIKAIRTEVFILEQGVPEDREFDQHDSVARHFLARDNETGTIGTARLTSDGQVGRMAVEKSWRGGGVGDALLRNVIEDARLQHLPEIRLAAQTQASGFYQRHGFEAYGEEFDHIGIPHRWMKLTLGDSETGPVERTRRQPATLQFAESLEIDHRRRLGQVLLELLGACGNELAIWTRDLEGPLLDNDAMLEAIRQIAVAAPRPEIRILLLNSARAVKDDHRLLKLAQRLPSSIHIRRPGKHHQEYVPAFVVADRKHSIFREFGDRPGGVLQPSDRLYARRLMEFFDQAWEQSETDPELRLLDI